ncbi:MAG: PAS domain-containing sensor histidine kinase [Muribaculaceae bacterium]|nr:PAS domain-containing sensor histidine kinase [Muribaculaceae bacterium]
MTRSNVYFGLSLVLLVAAGLCGYRGHAYECVGLTAAGVVALVLFRRATVKPMRAIRSGMDLLLSQDFASRLRPVGQKDADEVVRVFNAIMGTMKSERLKNEEQNAFLSKIVEASPMGVAVCTFDGEIESSNPAFKDLGGEALEGVLSTLGDGEQRIIRPGGEQVLKCVRMHFMDRGFRRRFYLVERLTDEIVRAETELFHKIVRTMGHEVNNTLGGVVSVLETLQAVHEGDEIVAEALDSSRSSCLALTSFVKAYSDVVKLPDAEPEAIDVAEFLRRCLPFLQKMCPPNIRLRVDAKDGSRIEGDPMLLERVIVNAVKNAVESIGSRDGEIALGCSGKRIEITDNGPGISAENAERVFTPFFSTKRADRGLGLMLIADILRKHGAAFNLSTDADGLTRLRIDFAK